MSMLKKTEHHLLQDCEISQLIETKEGMFVLIPLEDYMTLKNKLKELTALAGIDTINRDIALLSLEEQERLWQQGQEGSQFNQGGKSGDREDDQVDDLAEKLYIEPIGQ